MRWFISVPPLRVPGRRGMRAGLALLVLGSLLPAGGVSPAQSGKHVASLWEFVKFPAPQPLCQGLGFRFSYYFDRGDCGFGTVAVSETTSDSEVIVRILGPDGTQLDEQTATFQAQDEPGALNRTSDAWQYSITPTGDWPSGTLTVEARVKGDNDPAGTAEFFMNTLGADINPPVKPDGSLFRPGEPLQVSGTLNELDSNMAETSKTGVPARFSLQVVTPSGQVRGPYGPFTAGADGTFEQTLPAEATAGLVGEVEKQFLVTVSVEALDASYEDPASGDWVADRAGAGAAVLRDKASSLLVDVKYLSDVGWVKPGESYPFRVLVHNFTDVVRRGAVVRLPAVDGTTFTRVAPQGAAGTASITNGAVVWNLGDVAAGKDEAPTTKALIVEARADTLGQDPQIAWKNLSATAVLTQTGAAAISAVSHGPKVIPPFETYETARYGDRPFPVVPVDFFDRAHTDGHSGALLADVINSPLVRGSTFNLYQEMSFGQLFPHGTVPSSSIATASWDVDFQSERYRQSGFVFSDLDPQGTCKGATFKATQSSPVYAERIRDGWYQLPGDTEYYGGDRFGSGLVGAQIGNSFLQSIDSACGPTSKAVYDAAMIADPEIDYSDYDSDKDGVVDFFMMVFVGLGGNGESQTGGVPPYDNIWPHSSNLEVEWVDAETGQRGYVSDDQLRDLEDRPLYYTDADRVTMTTTKTDYPVYVRVGPYNVNPEGAIEKASVISHEYGHSLGLPDFYRNGGLATYGSWNLMATDFSQHMDVFGKQELGWIIPRVLPNGETTIRDWRDSKRNTHRIDWVTPDGKPYVLEGPGVNNGEAYVAKLPAKRVIDPKVVEDGASAPHVWWSGSGNDFGCPPLQGHNFDVSLSELAKVPAGTSVTATFKSFWEIEWDFDYGFVMLSTDGGKTFSSLASQNAYTTPAVINPNTNGCQTEIGNGITGSSGSYANNTMAQDRVNGEFADPQFVDDSYDLSSAAGTNAVLRFSYSTDPGLAKKGWFIDDLKVTAGDKTIYQSDFEGTTAEDAHLYNGGCRGDLKVAPKCTAGWNYLLSSADSVADHAYYMEMRDRSGFEFKDGHGQSDRGDISFLPGLLMVFTDENHGYGNNGVSGPPAQSPVDSQPQDPADGADPNLDDAAFTAATGDNLYTDGGNGYTDNYEDPSSEDGRWHHAFGCLSVEVLTMTGDDIGPDTAPGNLVGDVRIKTDAGCGPFDRGFNVPNLPPIPILQLKPGTPKAGEQAFFDGGESYDDKDASNRLKYEWDFGGDGTYDATGAAVRRAFSKPGAYRVVLRVTDTVGASATTSQTITVSGVLSGKQLPATGLAGWPALYGALGLALSLLLGRTLRRRAL